MLAKKCIKAFSTNRWKNRSLILPSSELTRELFLDMLHSLMFYQTLTMPLQAYTKNVIDAQLNPKN